MNDEKTATVLWFDRKLGWGWALPDNPEENDVFIHRDNLPRDRRFVLGDDRIAYELGEHAGKPCATNIRFIGRNIAWQVSEARNLGSRS